MIYVRHDGAVHEFEKNDELNPSVQTSHRDTICRSHDSGHQPHCFSLISNY